MILRHNLLLTFRSFKKYKGSFFINLIGLSTGLSCALLIYLWVNDELNFDKFHEKDSQLFQVMANYKQSNGIVTSPATQGPLADALVKEMPEVEYATTTAYYDDRNTLAIGNNSISALGRYASKSFFNVFSYELLQGNKDQVLADKNSIVISEGLARKLFNDTKDIVGKQITFQNEKQFLISGVFKDVPHNSSDQFEFVLPFEVYEDFSPWVLSWDNTGPNTYMIVKEGADIQRFNSKLGSFLKSKSPNTNIMLFAVPFSNNYLHGKYVNGVSVGGRIEYVRLFSIIAIFIVVIACVNFMNLSTAKASRKIKEVGIKKTIGVTRQMLIGQYLVESLLITFFSLVIAVLLAWAFLGPFNVITGKHLSLNFNMQLILVILGIILFTGLGAGSYPAIYLSGFKPAVVLKGKLTTSFSEVFVRRGLVLFQFVISIIFIIAVLVVYNQVRFIQTQNVGYNRDNIVYFEPEGNVTTRMESFLTKMNTIPGIINASSAAYEIGSVSCTYDVQWKGKSPDDKNCYQQIAVNYNLIELLDIKMAEGRSFAKEYSADSTRVIFNESAIKAMGLKNPLGQKVRVRGKDLEIVGVVKDFYLESLHQSVKPLLFRLDPADTWIIMAKIKGGQEAQVIEELKEAYQEFNPGYLLNYKFMDEVYQAQYVAEQRLSVLSRYFAALAIIISCLGLFGLAVFIAERRSKEVAIRRVLGSSDFQIMMNLSSEFAKIVGLSIVIALPIGYFLSKNWLDNFALRISLSPLYFVAAGLIAFFIAMLTVGSQAIKASKVNPLKSLKE